MNKHVRSGFERQPQKAHDPGAEDRFAGNVLTFEQVDGGIYYLCVSPPRVVEKIMEMAELQPGETLYDLGAGDGRILIRAAQEHGVSAVGIESHSELVEYARRTIRDLSMENRCKILKGDLREADLHEADVIVFYLGPEDVDDKIRAIFQEKLEAGARIVTVDVAVPELGAEKTVRFRDGTDDYVLYRYG
jgi:cyclopropane fatty-acyl-phospholipid synthase-like methyltransferase